MNPTGRLRAVACLVFLAVEYVGTATVDTIESSEDGPRVEDLDGEEEDTETCLLQRIVEKASQPLKTWAARVTTLNPRSPTAGSNKTNHEQFAAEGELDVETISALLQNSNHVRKLDTKLVVLFIILGVTGGFGILFALACCIVAHIIGQVIRTGIQTFDTAIIGTDVTFKNLYVDLFRGAIQISDMTIHNPKKEPAYTSEYLFHAGEVNIVVNMRKMIWTRMHSIDVHALIFKHAKAFYERPSLTSNHSNVQDILDFMKEHHQRPKLPTLPLGRFTNVLPGAQSDKAASEQAEKTIKVGRPDASNETHIDIKELDINDVGVEVICSGRHLSLTLPQLQAEDFQKECDGNTVTDIVKALVKKLGEALATEAMHSLKKYIGFP